MAHTALVEDSYETRKLKKCSVSKINRLHPKQIDFSSNETEPLVCALCGDVCANLEVFKMHVCKQLPRNMLKCTDCGVLLINKKEFEGHIYSHFCAKTEQCFEELHALVNKNNKVNYPRSTDLALRLLNHEEDDCSKTFKIETDVQFLKFPCVNCGSIFVDKAGGSENENAIRDMLNDESQKPRYCEKCNSKQQYNELQKNKTENATKKKDTRPYKYADCGDGFKRPYHLKRHESVHRPIIKQHNFKCSRCCMFFNTKLLLMDHRKATHPSCEDTDGNQTNEDTFLPTEGVENNSEPYHGTGKEYKCQDCDAIFRRMSVLKHHQRVHQEPYKCKECEDTFSTESDLQQHDCPEHDSHHCDDCGMSFSNGQLLCSHRCRHTDKDEDQSSIADHSPKPLIENTSKNPLLAQLLKRTNHCIERSFSCKECGKTFKRQCDLCDHVALHSGEKPFKCDICNAKYATARKLKKHLISHSTRYACKECGKGFSSQYRLRQHMATHSSEKPFICDLCGLGYATVKNLTQHRTRHTKPFVCTKCGKGYACSAYLRIHSNFHTGEMPFSCSFCSAKFRSPSNLRCHESIHSTDKPYKCKICNKAFTTRVRYKDHQVVHAENTYLCETCGSAFASRKRLLNHQIAHIGKKPYACDECGKTFARKLTVGIHMRIHTGERPFKCKICAATFIQQSHLNKHLRTMHETVLYETESI